MWFQRIFLSFIPVNTEDKINVGKLISWSGHCGQQSPHPQWDSISRGMAASQKGLCNAMPSLSQSLLMSWVHGAPSTRLSFLQCMCTYILVYGLEYVCNVKWTSMSLLCRDNYTHTQLHQVLLESKISYHVRISETMTDMKKEFVNLV